MYKVKIFNKATEYEIEKWLQNYPRIEIVQMTQSCEGPYNKYINIVILYKELPPTTYSVAKGVNGK